MAFGFSCRTNRIFFGIGVIVKLPAIIGIEGQVELKNIIDKVESNPIFISKEKMVPLFFKKATSLYSSIHRQRPILVLKVTRN